MDSNETSRDVAPQGLRIGAAARVTGLTASTIRAWEQRYGAINPHRTPAGYRLYDPETIERLQLLQGLRVRGELLPNLAACTTDELRRRTGESYISKSAQAQSAYRQINLVLAHPTLPATIAAFATAQLPFKVVHSAPHFNMDTPALPSDTELVVVRLDALGADPLATLARISPAGSGAHVLVETGFTKRATVEALKRRGYSTAQGPLTLDDLSGAALTVRRAQRITAAYDTTTPQAEQARFSKKQLSTLRELPSNVNCECPRHLATLTMQLAEFEEYSLNCHDEEPEDAALHAYLAKESGHARQLVEEMLARVCEAEGIAFES